MLVSHDAAHLSYNLVTTCIEMSMRINTYFDKNIQPWQQLYEENLHLFNSAEKKQELL